MQEAESEKIAAALAIVHQARARIEALSGGMGLGGAGISLRAVAERLYSDRRKRDEHFPPGLFGEPAWDLLLALYIANQDGRDFSLGDVADAALIDPEEARDLTSRIEKVGLVVVDGANRLSLTRSALERLTDYLARIF